MWSLQDHGNTNLPLKEDNLSITVKLAGPQSVHYLGWKPVFKLYMYQLPHTPSILLSCIMYHCIYVIKNTYYVLLILLIAYRVNTGQESLMHHGKDQ